MLGPCEKASPLVTTSLQFRALKQYVFLVTNCPLAMQAYANWFARPVRNLYALSSLGYFGFDQQPSSLTGDDNPCGT